MEIHTVTFDFVKYPISGFEGDVCEKTVVNDEYPIQSWYFLNDQNVPMVGLSFIEDIPRTACMRSMPSWAGTT